MIQLWFGLTFVVLFVIMIFVGGVSVPVYALTARGRWKWTIAYMSFTVGWTWILQHFSDASMVGAPAALTESQVWWSQYWWAVSLLFYMAVGASLGEAVRRQWSSSVVVMMPVAVGCALIAVAVAVLVGIGPANLGHPADHFVIAEMNQLVSQTVAAAKDVSAEQLVLIKDVGAQLVRWSLILVPSTIWLMGLAVTMLTLFLGKFLIPRALWMKYQGGLTRWKAPGVFVWLVIILGGLFFANARGLVADELMPVVYNGLLGIAGLFLLQGAMIVVYYIRRQREGFFRWMWYGLMVVFVQTAVIVMILLGIFDYWVDFRKVDRKIVL